MNPSIRRWRSPRPAIGQTDAHTMPAKGLMEPIASSRLPAAAVRHPPFSRKRPVGASDSASPNRQACTRTCAKPILRADVEQRRGDTQIADMAMAIFSRAAEMLAQADTIQKAKELKDLSLTAADFARRKGMGKEAIEHCESYVREAELRMGELLLATERAKGTKCQLKGRKPSGGIAVLPPEKSEPTLRDIGAPKRDSADSQALASLPTKLRHAALVQRTDGISLERKRLFPASQAVRPMSAVRAFRGRR